MGEPRVLVEQVGDPGGKQAQRTKSNEVPTGQPGLDVKVDQLMQACGVDLGR